MLANKLRDKYRHARRARLFGRYSTAHNFNPDQQSPFELKTPTQLLSILKNWRFVRDDDYSEDWITPLPPWQTRNLQNEMAEKERENAERQLMLIEDMAMSEFLEEESAVKQTNFRFCMKVAHWLLHTKVLPRVFRKVGENTSEREETKLMMMADVLSKVEESRYRELLVRKQKRFLSNKRLEYNRWVKSNKKTIKEVEAFNKVEKKSIDWYCDNPKCEARNFKLIYVCERCGAKHDPKVDEEKTEDGEVNQNFFRRRARRRQKEKGEELENAIFSIINIHAAAAANNMETVLAAMERGIDNVNVQATGSAAMGSITLKHSDATEKEKEMQVEGVKCIVEAMSRFFDDVYLQRAAVKTLLNIILTNDLPSLKALYRGGVIPAVNAAMVEFPDDSIIQWHGSQISMRLCYIHDEYGRMIWKSGGLINLQNVWKLRKTWSVKRKFRKELSLAIRTISEFAVGGKKYDAGTANSSRATSASSLGTASDYGEYSVENDDKRARIELKARGIHSPGDHLSYELKKQRKEDDLFELSEDEEDFFAESKVRSNITQLLQKKGWRVGRHAFVPECMESLFERQKEFDLHRLDSITKLYVPSRSGSRASSRQSAVSGGGLLGVSRPGTGMSAISIRSDISLGRLEEGEDRLAPTPHSPATPYYEPLNVNIREDERPITRDRPGYDKFMATDWNEKILSKHRAEMRMRTPPDSAQSRRR